jgi:hypothetical protein
MTTSEPALPQPPVPHHGQAVNGVLARLLRSPLHGLTGGRHLLISYNGRRTGVGRELPVQYARLGRGFVVRVGHPEAARWWRNFREPWPLTVVIDGRPIAASGCVVAGGTDRGLVLAAAYFERFPASARRQGLPLRRGETPDPEAVRRAASCLLFLDIAPMSSRIEPKTDPS